MFASPTNVAGESKSHFWNISQMENNMGNATKAKNPIRNGAANRYPCSHSRR
jgi:hypothetical protein